jgi:putative transposase
MSVRYDKLVSALKGRLPEAHLDALGRTVEFIVRLRAVRASAFVWSVVLSRLTAGRPGFERARQLYCQLTRSSIWRRPFQMRFKCAAALKLFERVFEELVAPSRGRADARGIKHPLSRYVADIVVVDGSLVPLCDSLGRVFRGVGQGGTAMLKVVLTISAFGSIPLAAQLVAGAAHDNNFFPRLELFARGSLFLFDKGFFDHRRLRAIQGAKHHFLCAMRRSSNPRVVRAVAAPRRARARLDAQPRGIRLREILSRDASVTSHWDLDVDVDGVICRLVIVPGRGRKARPYYTTLSRDTFRPAAIAEMYRLRWQIELVFKELKQHLSLEAVPTRDPIAAQVLVWASLIALVISRCVTAWLWPSPALVGLASQRRPSMISRALGWYSAFLGRLLTTPLLRTRWAMRALADGLRAVVLATRSTTRADSFSRLAILLRPAA